MKNVQQQGVTLVELMVALAILAVLASVAIPSLASLSNSSRLSSAANQLNSAVRLAKSEAIKRKTSVTLTAKDNDWSKGWLVTVKNGEETETLLIGQSINSAIKLDGSSSSAAISFGADGFTDSSKPWDGDGVTFCDSNKLGRQVSLKRSGTVTVSKVTCS